jgi:hypothetical protein
MTVDASGEFVHRAGQAPCVCGPAPTGADDLAPRDIALLAAAFGLSVLAQALALLALPEASRLIAPRAEMIGWPFALALVGAALASLPAAFLADAFGRRAIVALGASLGVAGGALGLFAMARGNFPLLCLAGFWLGTTQGFGLYYRHVAALSSRLGAGGGALVFGGGAFAALLAPLAVTLGESFAGGELSGALIGAVLMHVVGLAVAARLPAALASPSPAQGTAPGLPKNFAFLCGAGALAWFAMSATMLHGPGALAQCGASSTFVGGAMAWHLLAMYAPGALAAWRPALIAPRVALLFGAGVAAIAALLTLAAGSLEATTMAMLAVGAGWSLANIGALRLLYAGPRPSRAALAAHDFLLLAAAAAGALARFGAL